MVSICDVMAACREHLVRFIFAAQLQDLCASAIIISSVGGVVAVLVCTSAPGTKLYNFSIINDITVFVTPECCVLTEDLVNCCEPSTRVFQTVRITPVISIHTCVTTH